MIQYQETHDCDSSCEWVGGVKAYGHPDRPEGPCSPNMLGIAACSPWAAAGPVRGHTTRESRATPGGGQSESESDAGRLIYQASPSSQISKKENQYTKADREWGLPARVAFFQTANTAP